MKKIRIEIEKIEEDFQLQIHPKPGDLVEYDYGKSNLVIKCDGITVTLGNGDIHGLRNIMLFRRRTVINDIVIWKIPR